MRYTTYKKCKCGNDKGIEENYKENNWGEDELLKYTIKCETCKKKYNLTREYIQHYKGDSHSYYVYTWCNLGVGIK